MLGFSLGGMVAQQIALERLDAFRRLMLVGTAPRGGEEIMVRFQPGAGIYAPIRIVLYGEDGGSVLAYDRPSDQFGQFGDGRVTQVGRDLDREVEALVLQVLAPKDGDPAG